MPGLIRHTCFSISDQSAGGQQCVAARLVLFCSMYVSNLSPDRPPCPLERTEKDLLTARVLCVGRCRLCIIRSGGKRSTYCTISLFPALVEGHGRKRNTGLVQRTAMGMEYLCCMSHVCLEGLVARKIVISWAIETAFTFKPQDFCILISMVVLSCLFCPCHGHMTTRLLRHEDDRRYLRFGPVKLLSLAVYRGAWHKTNNLAFLSALAPIASFQLIT